MREARHPRPSRKDGLLAAVGAALLWASINVILKHVSGTQLHPIGVSCLLYLSALSVLAPALAFLKRRYAVGLVRSELLRWPNLLAGLAKAGETLFFVYAVRAISATQTTMLKKLSPVWVYIILVLFLRERLRVLKVIGTLLAVAGIYVLLGFAPDAAAGNGAALGAVFAILSGFSFAVFSVVLERGAAAGSPGSWVDRLQTTVCFLGSALLFVLPFGIAFLPGRYPSLSDLLWIYLAGGVFTGTTYFLYYTALTKLSSLLVVLMLSLIVVFTMLLELLFLGTATLTPSFAIGAAVILVGVLLVLSQREASAANTDS